MYRRESSKYIRCLLKSVGAEVAFAGFMRLLTIALLFINLLVFRYRTTAVFAIKFGTLVYQNCCPSFV